MQGLNVKSSLDQVPCLLQIKAGILHSGHSQQYDNVFPFGQVPKRLHRFVPVMPI